ncbi:carboxypeptidase-like regulatory domain-containing protein [Phocaeicola faecicola]|uniref:carboxypeptidase-like regulatory domain-containing protein n=1 Tax=Phocaeicola faecicola TaxID=2739389 RepID=UPI0015E6BACE|nr:carboxypeptidase-like regulatory domain-containing protein [Phocaeicola faecicola]
MKILGLTVWFWLFYVLPMISQVLVKGNVKSENKQEVIYASIQLLHPDSSFVQGTITDSIGNYCLQNVYSGDYLLFVSSMGYIPQWHIFSIGIQDKKLPLLTLKKDNILLDEVVVKASSFVRQKDRVLIIPTEQQVKHASTGYDLLYNLMIPGMSVNTQKGSVNTLLGEATLYINGQKADNKEIHALRPKDIEKIEYFEMPTGKYAGDKASVNYILKKKNTGGYVALDGMQTIGYLGGDYNANLKVVYKSTSYTLFAGHSMEHNDGIRTDKKEVFYFPEQEISRTTHVDDAELNKNKQYAQLNINNNNDKRTLAGKISFVHQSMPDNYSKSVIEYDNTPVNDISAKTETTQTALMPSLNLYGSFKLGQTQFLNVNLTATYTNNEYIRKYTERNYFSHTKVDESLYNITFSTDYNIQLKHNNSFGLNFSHLHSISSATYKEDFKEWSHLWTTETLLMGQYNQSIGKIYMSLQFGGDLLQYCLHGNEAKRYLSPHANILLNYQINSENSILYGLNTGNSNPPMEWINNVNQELDSLSVKRGNPHLERTNYYNSYLVYNHQTGKINLQVAGLYFGAINSVFSDYYIENDKLVNTFRTGGNFHQLKGSLAVTYKIIPSLHIKLLGFYRYNEITGKVKQHRNEWGGSMDINYYWKDFAFNIHGKSTGKTLDNYPAFVDTPANYGAFVRWNHKNWMAEAGTDNTFSKHNQTKMYMDMGVYRFHNSSYSETYQKTGYIKVAYTFDFGKNTSKEQRNINTTINSAILKAE